MQHDQFEMSLLKQTHNSTYFNILDLGLFKSTQSFKHEKLTNTIDELVEVTEEDFHNQDASKLNNVFISYHFVMENAIKCECGNNYKMQYIGK